MQLLILNVPDRLRWPIRKRRYGKANCCFAQSGAALGIACLDGDPSRAGHSGAKREKPRVRIDPSCPNSAIPDEGSVSSEPVDHGLGEGVRKVENDGFIHLDYLVAPFGIDVRDVFNCGLQSDVVLPQTV